MELHEVLQILIFLNDEDNKFKWKGCIMRDIFELNFVSLCLIEKVAPMVASSDRKDY